MELLVPDGAEVLASYDHYNWKDYAAITRNHYGKGQAVYVGCMTDEDTLKAVYKAVLSQADVEIPEYQYQSSFEKEPTTLANSPLFPELFSGRAGSAI